MMKFVDKMLKKNYEEILLFISSFVVIFFMGLSFFQSIEDAKTISQSRLEREKSALNSLQHISDALLHERQWLFQQIANSDKVRGYFIGESVGMTKEYGLKAGADAVTRYFDEVISGKGKDRHFSALVLYDRQGQVIAQAGPSFPLDRNELAAGEVGFQVQSDEALGDYLLLTASVTVAGEAVGALVGVISLESWFTHLFASDQASPPLPNLNLVLLVGPTRIHPATVHEAIKKPARSLVEEARATAQPAFASILEDEAGSTLVFVLNHSPYSDLNLVRVMEADLVGLGSDGYTRHVFIGVFFALTVLFFLLALRLYYRSIFLAAEVTATQQANALVTSKNEQLVREMAEKKRIREALASRESLLSGLINTTPDLIFYTDSDAAVLGSNASFNQFFAITDANATGSDQRAITRFFPFINEHRQAVLVDRKTVSLEEWVRNTAGEEQLFDCLITPFIREDEERPGLLGVFRDVTDNRRLALEVQRQEEQFKLILEGVNIGVWRVCVDTGEVQVSKAGELLGFAPEKLEHLTIETFLDLIHPAEQSGLHRLLLDCLEGESNFLEHEFRMRHQDGCWTWVFAKGRMISQNELRQGRWFVAILVDISSRISAEQELQAMNNLLEERIAQRTEELNKVYAQLMQQEKMVALGQLAAGISHELNNPVNFIQINFATLQGYFTDFMELYRLYRESLEGLDTREHSPVRRALDKREQEIQLREILLDIPLLFDETERGFDRVAHIIGSMRNFSRQNKETVLEEVDINECIQDTITLAYSLYKYEADVLTRLGQLPRIQGVGELLNQVFLNLIVNAAQAIRDSETRDRGRIVIETWSDADNVHCTVKDDGPGITEEHLPRLFEPFFTTKEPGNGTGLGLSVSYDIVVNKHNGSLVAGNQVKGGAVFTVSLPLRQPNLQ